MGTERMTTKDVYNWVKSNSECNILGETTKGGRKAYIFKCGCGEEFTMSFSNFKKGNMACKTCSDRITRESKSFSYDYVKSYIESKGCKLLSDSYKNCDDKLLLECGECGDKYQTTFYQFKNRNVIRCRGCSFIQLSKNQSFEYEYVKKYICDTGCELVSKSYKNNQQKLSIKCSCGNIFKNTFAEFKMKKIKQCPECGNKLKNIDTKFSYEEMKTYINSVGLELITDIFYDVRDEIYVKCKCGEIFKSNFAMIKYKNKNRCNACTGWNRFDMEYIRKYVAENSDCEIISKEYINSDEKLLFRCACSDTFETTFDKFKGKRMKRQCNECSERSNMEKITREILKSYSIKYIKEKSFRGCENPKTGYKLRYDYYLPNYNLLIELDGIQHFEMTKFHKMSDEEANTRFEDQKFKDEIKNRYALDSNIKLIRIPYWDILNIEGIIINELKLNSVKGVKEL